MHDLENTRRPETGQDDRGIFAGTVSTAGGIADYLVLLLVALFGYELVARNFFHAPTGFADQLAAYALPAISFLALARSLRAGGHVSIDIVTSRVGPETRAWLARLCMALEVLVCMGIAVLSFNTVIEAHGDGLREFVGQWLVHEYLPMLVIPVGFFLAGMQCARDLLRSFR